MKKSFLFIFAVLTLLSFSGCKEESSKKPNAIDEIQFSDSIKVALELPEDFKTLTTVDSTLGFYNIFSMVMPEPQTFNITHNGDIVGAITLVSTEKTLNDETIQSFKESKNPRIIYQGIMTGMNNTWDIKYNVILENETEGTATSFVYHKKDFITDDLSHFGQPFLDEEDDVNNYYNKAVLGYNLELKKYVAIEFYYDSITDEQIKTIAKTLKIS